MKSSSTLILAAVMSALLFTACKKPPEPSQPSAPDPQAQASADDSSGKTTNFESPTAAEPAKPAGQ
jgi:hypothetical protein